MAKEKLFKIEEPCEKAILVGVIRRESVVSLASSLEELERLANTAGAEVVSRCEQRLETPNPRTFIGSGKADEVAKLCEKLDANIVIFDDELTPSQQSNLEKVVPKGVKVIDRTALILDIFALHATSREGRLQVRLAQSQYLLPRLRGMWAHLASNRMGGGVGSRFGEGESQLEVDRRMVRKRITSIKRELSQLAQNRALQRSGRYESGVFKVALAGYTNAGKSSLLNTLTSANVLTYDKLFATLDSTTRKYILPEGREITITDTVGFIRKLPTTLIEAFKSTLDEIVGSDLILHVIDSSFEEYDSQVDAVEEVLQQIGAEKIKRIEVFNKIDRLTEDEKLCVRSRHRNALFVSAHTGEGIDELVSCIARIAASNDILLNVCIPYDKGELVSLAHERCNILHEEHTESGTHLTMQASSDYKDRFEAYKISADS